MNLIRLVQLNAIHKHRFVAYFDGIARHSDDSLDEWNIAVGRRLERHDIAAPDRPVRQIMPNERWIICRKRDLVEKKMITDEDRWLHRLRWDLCCLSDIACEYKNENDRERQTFNPFAEYSLPAHGDCLKSGEFIEPDIRPFKHDKIFERNIRNIPVFNFGARTLDHADNLSFTNWLTRDPSALLPERRARVAFITFPISFIEAAPVSSMA